MRELIKIIFVVFFSLTLLSCSQEKQLVGSTALRVSGSQNPPQDIDAEDPGFRYIYLLKKPLFSGTINIVNRGNTKSALRLVAFINYEQVPFVLRGKKALAHKVILKPGDQVIEKFAVNIKRNNQFFVLVGLEDAEKSSLSLLNSRLNDFVLGTRFLLTFNKKMTKLSAKHYSKITPGKKSSRIISIKQVSKGIKVDIDWSKIKSNQFVIIPLVDFKQKGLFILNKKNTIDSFEIPKEEGSIYTLFAVSNPFDNSLESLKSSLILQSNRIILR